MKEDSAVEYPYVVVQFLQLPHADIGDYSCVPQSWIRSRRATDRKILVAYPDESPSITNLRIMNGDEPFEKWELYMAIIKLESHSYENACEFIMEKIYNASKNKFSDVMRIDYELLPATTTKRSSPPLKKIKLPDHQSKKNRNNLKVVVMKKPYKRKHQDQAFRDVQSSSEDLLLRYPYIQQIPETDNGTEVNILGGGLHMQSMHLKHSSDASIACANSTEHQDSIVEDMVVDELTEASCIEQNVFSGITAENESSANSKALEEANHSGQTEESSMEERSPMVEVVTSSGILSSQDVDYDEQSNSSELSSDETINTSPNSNEQANQSVLSVLNKADVWADQLFDLFQKMKINSSEICQIVHDLHESLVQTQKTIESIANASENLRALKKGKVTVGMSKEVTAEVQQIAEENQAERKEEENPDVSMEKDKEEDNNVDSKSSENDDDCDRDIKDVKDQGRNNEVPKKIRDHIRTFVLPPEYDPHDTRWTLKYRENDSKLNLVELVAGSNVFINSLKLAHCKLAAKESKELARMLFVEIFSQSALSVCSLTGARANAFDISGTNVRPGLDEKARITILSFVKDHALEKNWGPFDSQSVINSLRSKIQDIRAKHGKEA